MNFKSLLLEILLEAITAKQMLGKGKRKVTYPIETKADEVVKKWEEESDEAVEKEIKIARENPDLVAEIIKYDPVRRIMVQRRLDTDRVEDEMKKLRFTNKMGGDRPNDVFQNILANFLNKRHFKGRMKKYISIINKNTFKDTDESLVELYRKWYEFFGKLDDRFDDYTKFTLLNLDLHAGNVGYDKDGKIKLLDL